MRSQRKISRGQPGEYPSFRRRCFARDCFKGSDRGRRIESSHKARITAAHSTSVPPGIVCEEKPACYRIVDGEVVQTSRARSGGAPSLLSLVLRPI